MIVGDPELEPPRALRGRDVEIDNASENTCRWMDCLNSTTYGRGNRVASGVMFSVTAKQTLEILSLEIDHYTFDGDLEVEIFTRPGADYIHVFSDPAEWIMVAQTPIIRAPEGTGSIVPRSAFQSIQMAAGETLSFYVALTTHHLKLSATSDSEDVSGNNYLTTGDTYASDDFLQINVGIALRTFKFPETTLDLDAAFRGVFHYQAVQSCTAFTPAITSMVLKFAVQDGVDVRSSDFLNAFMDLFSTEPQLFEFTKFHGLQIDQLQAIDMGLSSLCGNLIVSGNCRSYQASLDLQHYPTLSPKEVKLGIYTALSGQESLFRLESGFDVVYVGDKKALVENFQIVLTGLPQQTILSPIHRRYVEHVTFTFLERFAPVEPYQVEVSGQIFDRRGKLRRLRTDDRELQSTGIVKVQALIYGVGDNAMTFFEAIEDTFIRHKDRYLLDLSKERLRPSDINEFDDLGYIFADLFSTSVSISSLRATERTGSVSDDGGLTKEEIQNIVFSVVLGLSSIWLIYRIAMDYFYVKRSDRITQFEKVSGKKKKNRSSKRKQEKQAEDEKEISKKLVNDPKPPPKPMSLPKRVINRSNSWTGLGTSISPMIEATENKSDGNPDALHRPIKRSSSWTRSAEAPPTTETKADNRNGEKLRGVVRNHTMPLPRDHARLVSGNNARNKRDNRSVDETSSSNAQPPGSKRDRIGETGRGVSRSKTMPPPSDHVRSTSGECSPNDRGVSCPVSPSRAMRKPAPETSTTPDSSPFPPQNMNRSGNNNGREAVRNRTMPLPRDHAKSALVGITPNNRGNRGIDGGLLASHPFTERPRVVGIDMTGEAKLDSKRCPIKPSPQSSKENTRHGSLGLSILKTKAATASPRVQHLDTAAMTENNGNIRKKTRNKAPHPESPGTIARKKNSKSARKKVKVLEAAAKRKSRKAKT